MVYPTGLLHEALPPLVAEGLAGQPRPQPPFLVDSRPTGNPQTPPSRPRLQKKLKELFAFSWLPLASQSGPPCSEGSRGLCRFCCSANARHGGLQHVPHVWRCGQHKPTHSHALLLLSTPPSALLPLKATTSASICPLSLLPLRIVTFNCDQIPAPKTSLCKVLIYLQVVKFSGSVHPGLIWPPCGMGLCCPLSLLKTRLCISDTTLA